MNWLMKWWNSYCWHEWVIIYISPTGLFEQIECKKCKRQEHRGLYG